MFQFEALDGMSRLLMLKKQKETKEYWTAIHHLKGAFLAWGDQTSDLLAKYKLEGQDIKLIASLDDAAVRGEITVKKLSNLLVKIDDYLHDMDTRLSDGTKWYNAADIAAMAEESEAN